MDRSHAKIVYIINPGIDLVPIIQWLKDSPWCYGIQFQMDQDVDFLLDIKRSGLESIATLPSHPMTRDFKEERSGIPKTDLDDFLHPYISVAEQTGDKAKWLFLTEEDSAGVSYPQEALACKPETHQAAMALFHKRLNEALTVAKKYPDIDLWGVAGFGPSAHDFAALGLTQINLERTNDDVDDIQTGIAFCRGAAMQNDCGWGIDFSLWWGVIRGCVEKLPSLYHKRNLYLSYFSGAGKLIIEGFGTSGDNFDKDNLPALTQTIADFGEFSLLHEPGVPEIPVAIMLPKDHGWMTRPYWSNSLSCWSYSKVQYRQGDRGLEGFFSRAFPGSSYSMDPFPFGQYQSDDPPASPFALACITPELAPAEEDIFYAEPPVSFGKYHDRRVAYRKMHEDHLEPSDYRPMGTSRWGDIFDIFTTDVNAEILKKYPVLVLLGAIKLTIELKKKIQDYAAKGGKVICAAGVITPEDAPWTGLNIEPEFRAIQAWKWGNEDTRHEALRVLFCRTAGADTKVLAATIDGLPLVTQKTHGKGEIYSIAASWYESEQNKLSELALRLLDQVFNSVQPVFVEGLPVEWVSSSDDNHFTTLIANNSDYQWGGKIKVNRAIDENWTCRELITDEPVQNNNASVFLKVPKYDIRIVQWQKSNNKK